MTFSYKKS